MSKFSGKCDLYDHICMGAKEGDTELDCFNRFKKNTGGKIYQYFPLELTEKNIDFESKRYNAHYKLGIREHVEYVHDERLKSKSRKKVYYTYTFNGKEYASLKEMQKENTYFACREIKFDTILDLIPYYPYLISIGSWSAGHEYIEIADESYNDTRLHEAYKYGWDPKMVNHDIKNLQDHYREIVLEYFNPIGRECVEEVELFDRDGQLYVQVSNSIDTNFYLDVERGNTPIWSRPFTTDSEAIHGLINVSKVYPGVSKAGDKIIIKYVKVK